MKSHVGLLRSEYNQKDKDTEIKTYPFDIEKTYDLNTYVGRF